MMGAGFAHENTKVLFTILFAFWDNVIFGASRTERERA